MTYIINSVTLNPQILRQSKISLVLLSLLVIVACSSHIKRLPEDAQISIPSQWEPANAEFAAKSDEAAPVQNKQTQPVNVQNGWLQAFNDIGLERHVNTAINNNPDLISSAAQLKSAIEQVTITGSELWPNAQVGVQRNDTDTEVNGVTTEVRTVTGTLTVGWEADIWGKLTQRKKSSAYTALAQGELFKAAEFSLAANVSRAWYNLIANQLQVELAHQRLDSFQRTADLIDENYRRGLRSALDVYLSRTDVQTQISALADTQYNYVQSLRAFKVLLGEYPDSELEYEPHLPQLQSGVPTGLPAELLVRRPDLKASKLLYQAEIASAKAAHRDRFPSISFTGSIGDSRDKFNQLFDNDNMVVSLLSGITQPLFLAGALKSREKQAAYLAEVAYAELVKTTLTAFQEVENGISLESSLFAQHKATKEAVAYAQNALDLALDRYQSGIENYNTVLESQRRLFSSKSNEINIRNALLQNRVGIHLALGGDFMNISGRDPSQNLPSITKNK